MSQYLPNSKLLFCLPGIANFYPLHRENKSLPEQSVRSVEVVVVHCWEGEGAAVSAAEAACEDVQHDQVTPSPAGAFQAAGAVHT